MAINYFALGKCAKEYSAPLVSIGIFALGMIISILIKGIYSSSTWITPQGSDLFYLAAVIVLGVNGQLFLVRSFTYLKTPVAVGVAFSSLLFSGLLEAFLTGNKMNPIEFSAYLLVLLGLFISHYFMAPVELK